MKLILKTNVKQSPQQVWAGFNQSLFEKLAPPFPRVRLLRFDGSILPSGSPRSGSIANVP